MANQVHELHGDSQSNSYDCLTLPPIMRDVDSREYTFWQALMKTIVGANVNLDLDRVDVEAGLRRLRNACLPIILALNALWLVLLSVLYEKADYGLQKLNVYGLITVSVYGLVLAVQVVGMTTHRLHAVFTRFARWLLIGSRQHLVWTNRRPASF